MEGWFLTMRAILKKGLDMREVKVNKNELLAKVKVNLEKHLQEYGEAVEGYKTEARALLSQRRKEVVKAIDKKMSELDSEAVPLSLDVNLSFHLPVPESHEKDYRQVILMTEMSVDDTLVLKSDEFAYFVMDDWDWKESFLATSARYALKK
jgi:exonuclease VII small subunit